MKKLTKYIGMALLTVAGAALGGCNDYYSMPPVNIPGDGDNKVVGDGTWEKPLQTWQAAVGTTVDGHLSNWVTGYIVGWVDTNVGTTFNENTARFDADATVETNMVIAQYPYDEEKWAELEYSWKDCVTVQLPSGGVRSALNLVSNPDNFNRQVSIRGVTGSKYCGVYGVRSVGDFNWGPKGNEEEPITPIGSSYYCDFQKSSDINYYLERGWRNVAVRGGLSGWYIKNNSGENFASCSAYLGTSYGGPYENWLISPQFDLDKADHKTLSFLTQAGYTSEDSTLEVYVMTSKNPKVEEGRTLLECVIAQVPDNGFSGWVESGLIDLSNFSGKIYIGFRYYASQGGQGYSSEYHLRDFNIGGAEVPVDPDAPVIEPVEDHTFVKAAEVKSGKRYAMVYNSQVAKPVPEGDNYGYIYVEPFQRVTADSFISTNVNAFLFEKEDDGYTIRDYYGRYLYMDNIASHVSFQLSAKKPQINYIWKVEAGANGKFKITNTGRNRCIEWVSNFSNFSTVAEEDYANGGPVLYEMGE